MIMFGSLFGGNGRLACRCCTLTKPYVYLNIVAGALFATFILAPIGLLVGSVGDLLMGLMMLRKGPEVQPEFV